MFGIELVGSELITAVGKYHYPRVEYGEASIRTYASESEQFRRRSWLDLAGCRRLRATDDDDSYEIHRGSAESAVKCSRLFSFRYI